MNETSTPENQDANKNVAAPAAKPATFKVSDFLIKEGIEEEKFDFDKYVKEIEGIKLTNFFDTENSGYTDVMLEKLVGENLISEVNKDDKVKPVSKSGIIDLLNNASPIDIDEGTGELCIANDGEKTLINFNNFDLIVKAGIVDLLPIVSFDITQGGILERQKEAESIFKVAIVNSTNNGLFNNEIKKILKDYDVAKLKGKNGSFAGLEKMIVERYPRAQQLVIKLCNIRLSKMKTKKEMKIYTGLEIQEDRDLRKLKLDIANKQAEFDITIEAQTSRAAKEVSRQAMRTEIETLIEDSPVTEIYRILNLNRDDVNTETGNRFTALADALTDQIVIREDLGEYDSIVSSIRTKLKRRCFREYLAELRLNLYSQFKRGEVVNFTQKF